MKHLTSVLSLLIVVAIGLACNFSFGDETAKANETVSEANKFLTTANEAAGKISDKGSEFDEKVDAVKDDEDLKEARDVGKELLGLYSTMEENFKKSGDKFEEASKLKVNEKFKEYLELKAKEMKKRSEYSTELKKIPKALDDSKNEKEYRDAATKIVQSVQKMTQEAKDLGDAADKIMKDNPTIIKSE